MREVQEQGAPYPWYVPINVPDNEQATANFKIQVDQPSQITIGSFMVGTNTQNKHLLNEFNTITFEPNTDSRQVVITPESYSILICVDTTAVNLYHEVKIIVNNTQNDFRYNIPKDDECVYHYFNDVSWVGEAEHSPIPVDCTLIDSTNNSAIIFGDDEDVGDDSTPNNQVSFSFVNLRKDLYGFDFGMEPEP